MAPTNPTAAKLPVPLRADAARRILVIDDSALIREVARVCLQRRDDLVVQTASTGVEGVAAALARPPDAILLDVVMPDMDGPAALQALRAHDRTRAIPVVLVTGRDSAADRRAFSALGVVGVIAKPFDAATLAGQVRDMLGWQT